MSNVQKCNQGSSQNQVLGVGAALSNNELTTQPPPCPHRPYTHEGSQSPSAKQEAATFCSCITVSSLSQLKELKTSKVYNFPKRIIWLVII